MKEKDVLNSVISGTMRVSELIHTLQMFKKEYGDCPVFICDNGSGYVTDISNSALICITRKGEHIGTPALLLVDSEYEETNEIDCGWKSTISGDSRITM